MLSETKMGCTVLIKALLLSSATPGELWQVGVKQWFSEVCIIIQQAVSDLESAGKLNELAKWIWFASNFRKGLERLPHQALRHRALHRYISKPLEAPKHHLCQRPEFAMRSQVCAGARLEGWMRGTNLLRSFETHRCAMLLRMRSEQRFVHFSASPNAGTGAARRLGRPWACRHWPSVRRPVAQCRAASAGRSGER